MGLFIEAKKTNEVIYDNGATVVNTSYNLGDGYHKVKISGSNTNLTTTGKGDTVIKHYGDNASIKTGNGWNTIKSLGSNKNIETGDSDDEVVFIGNNINLNTNDGNDTVTFIGDNVNADTGKGNDKMIFWGHNCNLKLGEGDDSVTTYDQVYKDAKYKDLEQDFIDRLETGTWEDWQLKSKNLIDYSVKHSNWTNKKSETFVYKNCYKVDTYFSRYVNGVKNCSIDLGTGADTAVVNLGTNSNISSEKNETGTNDDNIIIKENWQTNKLIDTRHEYKITTRHKKSGGGVFGTIKNIYKQIGRAIVSFALPSLAIADMCGIGNLDNFKHRYTLW